MELLRELRASIVPVAEEVRRDIPSEAHAINEGMFSEACGRLDFMADSVRNCLSAISPLQEFLGPGSEALCIAFTIQQNLQQCQSYRFSQCALAQYGQPAQFILSWVLFFETLALQIPISESSSRSSPEMRRVEYFNQIAAIIRNVIEGLENLDSMPTEAFASISLRDILDGALERIQEATRAFLHDMGTNISEIDHESQGRFANMNPRGVLRKIFKAFERGGGQRSPQFIQETTLAIAQEISCLLFNIAITITEPEAERCESLKYANDHFSDFKAHLEQLKALLLPIAETSLSESIGIVDTFVERLIALLQQNEVATYPFDFRNLADVIGENTQGSKDIARRSHFLNVLMDARNLDKRIPGIKSHAAHILRIIEQKELEALLIELLEEVENLTWNAQLIGVPRN